MSQIAARRHEEKERRRAEIIDAAEAVFAQVGFEAATMQQIASKARLSRALVYVYFKDKSDLHVAVAERATRQLAERFHDAVARHRKGLDQIEAIGRAYLAFAEEFPVYFNALTMFESLVRNTRDEGMNLLACEQSQRELMGIMVEAIARGIKDESIRADVGDPLLTSIALWAFTHGIIQLSTAKAAAFAHDGISHQQLTRHALQMARRALQGPEG